MNARDALLVGLPAVLVGGAVGYVMASLGPDEARAAGATSRAGGGPVAAHAPGGPAPIAMPTARPGDDRGTAVSRPVERNLSAAEVDRAVGSVGAVAPAVVPSGPGTLAGRVLDEHDVPLPGATVLARARAEYLGTVDPTEVGAGAPVELSLDAHLRAAAEGWAETHGRSARVVTGADGVYAVTGLDEGAVYDVEAWLEGYELRPLGSASRVSPGRTVDFRARRVHAVPVELVYEGGGSPAAGAVRVERGSGTTTYAWSAQDPYLRLHACRVTLRGYSDLRPRASSRSAFDSDFVSDDASVQVGEGADPVRLVLEPRLGIRVQVVDTWEGGPPRGLQGVLLRLEDGAEVDEDELADSDRSRRVSADRFEFVDLVPGLYAVGVATYDEALLAHELVEVRAGYEEIVLEAGPPDPAAHLLVRAYGPSGEVLEDLDFRLEHESENNSNSSRINGFRGPSGAWWLRPGARFEDFFEGWEAGTTYALVVEHDELGNERVELRESQLTVDVHFEAPVSILAVVAGYVGSGHEGELSVRVSRVDPDEEEEDPNPWGRNFRWGRGGWHDTNLDADGEARFDALEPGTWRVTLSRVTQGWPSRELDEVEVQVLAGEQVVDLTIPKLHELWVLAPGLPEGSWLSLSEKSDSTDEYMGLGWFGGGNSATTDADGRAHFEGLLPGTYTLSANGAANSMEVVVPSGEVYFEARSHDAMRVSIGDMEGFLYQSGLRAGDVVFGANGVEFEQSGDIWNVLQAGKPAGDLLVRRDGATITVAFDEVPAGGNWWEKLGGQLNPTFLE